MYRHI